MCGICGIVNSDLTCVDPEAIERMTDTIRHRGPDAAGYLTAGRVALGMRRLSIIDLEGGQQPIYNERGTIGVVFNGEIYNYPSLRKHLEQRGHVFRTRCDTEVIVHAYEEWGADCPKHLRGMFVFAIWDGDLERVLIARDRLGKKPLYYYNDGKCTRFASEIKAILEDPAVPRQLDLQAMDTYLSLGYVPGPRTMFAGISKLLPGHCLILDAGSCRLVQYWDIPAARQPDLDFASGVEELRLRLEEAVRIRLLSDVPVGAFLSGGIDSSLIVGLMSRMASGPIDTFSVGFADDDLNELPHARVVAQYAGTRHHEIVVESCSSDLLEKLVWHFDEPIADPAAVPTYLVSELARSHVKVVLTGEGGDELFAGYNYYRWLRQTGGSVRLPEGLQRRMAPALAQTVNALLRRQRYHERTIWSWSLPMSSRLLAWVAVFSDRDKEKLYHPAFRRMMDHQLRPELGAARILASFYDGLRLDGHSGTDQLRRLLYVDTKVWLPDDLLMKVDKMSMACSLEARTPYLDHQVLEFVTSLPDEFKLRGDTSKVILKEVARGIVPKETLERPKQSFDVPIGSWLRGGLGRLVRELLNDGVIPGARFLNADFIERSLCRDVEAGRPGSARQLWALVILGCWARQHRIGIAM